MKLQILSLLCCTAMAGAWADDVGFWPVKVSNDGILKIAEAKTSVIWFNKQGNAPTITRYNFTPEKGFPASAGDTVTVKGRWNEKINFNAVVEERLTRVAPDEQTLDISIKTDAPIASNELSFQLILPVENFAGREVVLDGFKKNFPAEYANTPNNVLFSQPNYQKLSIQFQNFRVELSGGKGILVQDDRKYHQDYYSVRCGFTPKNGAIQEASLHLKIKTPPYNTAPISLQPVANFGFADDYANDGKGGWTDQGPENDLRMMVPGKQLLGGVSFDILNPSANKGKSCIVFGHERLPELPQTVDLPVTAQNMKSLCLLHALAFPPANKEKIGTVVVSYANGTDKSFPIVNGIDVANWWNPGQISNAEVAWTGENRSSVVGLYLTSLPLDPNQKVTRIKFVSAGNSMWMIAGLAAANDSIPRLANVPFYIVESAAWKPFDYPRDYVKNSVLDYSWIQDAPAGKHGAVTINNGKFVFAGKPDKPVKFFGTNVCMGACFLDKAHCEILADRIAAFGYNSVRLHHFDHQLSKSGTPELNPAELDKLDYLVKCFKDRGIYTTIDIYISRLPKLADLPELKRDKPLTMNDISEVKAVMMISDAAMVNWENYTRNLLTHRNPYTGLVWKDDPALCFISLINENTIFAVWDRNQAVKNLYLAKFENWLKDQNITVNTAEKRGLLLNQFLVESYNQAYARMAAFVKNLGCKAPLTDQNMWNTMSITPMRNNYDYVDNHFYWDHPHFPVTPWKMPMAFSSQSAVERLANCPSGCFPTRIYGKPFTVTEFNYCFPNANRGEGGALTGAYAALQDWDGIYRFTYTHNGKSLDADGPGGLFDANTEPIQYLSEKLALLLYLRGDVKPSDVKIAAVVKPDLPTRQSQHAQYPSIMRDIGLVAQSGSIVTATVPPAKQDGIQTFIDAETTQAETELLAGIKAKVNLEQGILNLEQQYAKSSTGELELDSARGLFKVNTPRSVALVTTQACETQCGIMQVKNQKLFAGISASSLDGAPLTESKRIMVLHLTDALNAKTKFTNKKMTLMESAGTLPHLVRRGLAEITLKLEPGACPKVYGIDLAGHRIGEIPATFSTDGSLHFTLDTFSLKTPCLVYEIVR